jgi:hypothetical protein
MLYIFLNDMLDDIKSVYKERQAERLSVPNKQL